MKLIYATATDMALTDEGPWRFERAGEFPRASRFATAQELLDWVRNTDHQLSRINGEQFTVITWSNTPEGFEPPLWKGQAHWHGI